MIIEDIDISWKFQIRYWLVFFELWGLCWILMLEILGGLWKQCLCWVQGGVEVFLKNMFKLWCWCNCWMWLLFFEYLLFIIWVFIYLFSIILFLLGLVIILLSGIYVQIVFLLVFIGMVLVLICLLQFVISLVIEWCYEFKLGNLLFWIIWYLMVYWMLSLFIIVVLFLKVMLNIKCKCVCWVSLDCGIGRVKL